MPNGADALPDPYALAVQITGETTVTTPGKSTSPDWTMQDGRKATLKKAETWFWTTDASTWATLTQRLDIGPVWVEATIEPYQIVIDPVDGVTPSETCQGKGTPVPPVTPITTASPDCSVKFRQETDGGTWPVTVSVRYSVTWRGFDGTNLIEGQTLPDLRSAPVVYALAVLTARTQLISGD